MPNFFLAKTDPETYSVSDLAIEKETNWDGLHNYQALIYIKQWQIGDLVFVYNSLGEARHNDRNLHSLILPIRMFCNLFHVII